jgi:hypothetical protein
VQHGVHAQRREQSRVLRYNLHERVSVGGSIVAGRRDDGSIVAGWRTLEDKLVVVMRMSASLSAKSNGMAMVWVKTLNEGVTMARNKSILHFQA